MRWTKHAPRGALVILTALIASVAIAACGGSSNSGKTTTSKNAASASTSKSGASRTAFTACLKQHGVTVPAGRGGFGFRRNGTTTTGAPPAGGVPGGGGGFAGGAGGVAGGGGGFAGGNSKFAKAFQACRSKLGSSGFGRGRFAPGSGARRFTPHFSATALKSYVSCIRKNGYPSMPEPDTSKGAKSVFPASVEKNAEFQAASRKCQSILFKAFRGTIRPGQSTVTTSSSTTSSA
jgi:hypothetical protein